jgi:hypothetical protein
MKRTILTLLLLVTCAVSAFAQVPYDKEKKQVIYTEVVNAPGLNKDALYDRAMVTLKDIYKEVDKKVTTNDKPNGVVELACSTRVLIKDPKTQLMVPGGFVKYKLKLEFKEGKYRYQFYDFHIDKGGYKFGLEHCVLGDQDVKPEDHCDILLQETNDDITAIIAKLKAGMAADKVQQKSDW